MELLELLFQKKKKKSCDAKICVDILVLNENIEIEYFPMASIDYTLSQFNNAKVLSIIDANGGFCKICLDPTSANLITFIIPLGRFKFNVYRFELKRLLKCSKK